MSGFLFKNLPTPYLYLILLQHLSDFTLGKLYDLKGRPEKPKTITTQTCITSTWDLTLKFENDDRNNAFYVKPFIKKSRICP
jgi:hypothetical protein